MKMFTLKHAAVAAMICGTATAAVAQPASSAPVPPEFAANKVIPIYSDAYTNPVAWNFNDWSSGTVFTAETIAGTEDNVAKFTTTDLGYFGWELQADVNAATMDKVHIDVYADEAFTFSLIPICRTPSSEVPQTVTVEAGKWTSVDLDLSVYSDGGADLSGIFQLKFANIGARTFYVDNVYFWKGEQTAAIPATNNTQSMRLTVGEKRLDISLSVQENIQVFNMLGICLYNETTQNATIQLPTGAYIVKAGNNIKKITVQ